MLIFESKDLPGLSLFLEGQIIESWHAANRGLRGHPSTICCNGLQYALRYAAWEIAQ